MQRREFVMGSIGAVTFGLPSFATFGVLKREVTWAPYQNLDLNPQDMLSDEDITRIIQYAKLFIPQTKSGRPAYDARYPDKPGTERPHPEFGKRITASELPISVPATYQKSILIKKGIAHLLAADIDNVVRGMLEVGLQFHATNFDHPTDGICVPSGFDWDWVLTVKHDVANEYRRAWIEAGYEWSATPSVQLTADQVRGRGWPTGWLLPNEARKIAQQYGIMPDLRIRECRTFFLDRYARINEELGLVNVGLAGKTGWLHGNAAVYNRPETPRKGPWLPSPYPGDSYRDANVALVQEAVARFGASRVTWTNYACLSADERVAQGLPDYVSLRDGGIRAIYDQWYGSRIANWSLAALVANGALASR